MVWIKYLGFCEAFKGKTVSWCIAWVTKASRVDVWVCLFTFQILSARRERKSSAKLGERLNISVKKLGTWCLSTFKLYILAFLYTSSLPQWKNTSFSLSLLNAIILRCISPLLVNISISKSASLSSYLFYFPWLSFSGGGKKKSFLWVTLLMQQAWNCKHLVEFPLCELQPTSECSANIWNSFCASQRPSPSLIEYFYEIHYGTAVMDAGDHTIETINVWDVVTFIQKTNYKIKVNKTCTPVPHVLRLLLAENIWMRWFSL